MQVEIAKHERMCQTGHALFGLIQNNNMPILDLLVRESLQNSLDAASAEKKSVLVQFQKGEFESQKLSVELDGITEALNEKYPGTQKFLAIQDSNTVGLTGPLHEGELRSGMSHGNLLKLVYEISNAQTQEGAGGSWGLGKTIYFRVGIGLVIYYSRIKKSNGAYESRLATTLVEDETLDSALLPPPSNDLLGRGIAWWGEQLGDKTIPIRNENSIKKILDIFQIPMYLGEETGTTIIIPYINEDKLLKDNICDVDEEGHEVPPPFYVRDFYTYIRNSVMKWYSPRLNNTDYMGKYLQVYVDSSKVLLSKSENFFQIMQGLYKKAIGVTRVPELGEFEADKIFVTAVATKGVLKSSSAGKIAYLKASKKQLGMEPPNNFRSPNELLNIEPELVGGNCMNKPIVAFTRKPGMIVSYETTGVWANKIPNSNADEFIIGLFVLNSENSFKDRSLTLEEYVRKSELADHTSWSDHSIAQLRPKVISSIQNKVSQSIAGTFKEVSQEDLTVSKTQFGKLLGDVLLPPSDYGHRPGGDTRRPPSKPPVQKTLSGLSMSIDPSRIVYDNDKMILEVELKASLPHDTVTIRLLVDSENGSLSAEKWEELGLSMPFAFDSAKVVSVGPLSNGQPKIEKETISVTTSADNATCKNTLIMRLRDPAKFKAKLFVTMTILDASRDKKPVFALDK